MQARKLETNGLEVSAIALGCMGMSSGYGPAKNRREVIGDLRGGVERGGASRTVRTAGPSASGRRRRR